MSNKDFITYGQYIREAREAKNMTVNDLAFAIDKNNVKKWENKIKKWEACKAYPDLNDIYKLAYIIEINPGELLVIRDRCRKQFIKDSKSQIKKRKLEKVLDASYDTFRVSARIFLLIAIVFFIMWLIKFVDVFYGNTAGEMVDKALTYQIDEYVNGETNVVIHK
jgi:transcriptional regulator with XRE-family HTH domain